MTIVYHGSKSLFDRFDYSKMGQNGTSEGFGFYFTNNKTVAENYAHGGFLYAVEFNGKKPLSSTKKTITRTKLKKFIRHLHKISEESFLWDYGDLSSNSFESVLTYAVNLTYDNNNNDVNMICELCNVFGSRELVLTELYDTLGYDSIQTLAEWDHNTGEENMLYIALVNDIIKIIEVTKQ